MQKYLIAALLLFLSGLQGFAADNIELLQKALAAAADGNEQALLNKKIGDVYASQDDLPQAAEFYIKALSSGQFPVEDRVGLAARIAWGGRLSEAAKEFRAIVAQDPANIEAGTGLARTLLWQDDTAGALEEIEKVLARSPGNRDALLVKAAALRRSNAVDEAIAIYNKLLEAGQEYEARSGLVYALLGKGDREAAAASAASLEARDPYQERELAALRKKLAAAGQLPPAADDIETLKKKLAMAADKDTRALLNRKIGDAYAAKEDYPGAAAFYTEALSLGNFTVEDRLLLATRLSWGGRLSEAEKEFSAVSVADPGNPAAGTALAKVLSWKGDLGGALAETERVLARSPGYREALLVRASALRWANRYDEAEEIYRKLLAGEDFEARHGLASTLLSKGDRKGALACAALLKPEFRHQEREAAALAAELAPRPVMDAGFGYYDDTDKNYVRRYALAYGDWAGNVKTDLRIAHMDASAPFMRNSADTLSAGGYTRIAGVYGVGGGLSLSQARGGGTGSFLAWNVRADKRIADGSVGVSAGTELLTDTAQLVVNRIRSVNLDFSADKNLGGRFFLGAGYGHKEYSDDNGSNYLNASASWLLLAKKPALTAGYKYRYLGFRRQSGGGYFDPGRYISHQVFVRLAYELGRFYARLSPYYGTQSMTRHGWKSKDNYSGGAGTLGFKAGKDISIEASGDGGNYALLNAGGYKYYQLGLKVIFLL